MRLNWEINQYATDGPALPWSQFAKPVQKSQRQWPGRVIHWGRRRDLLWSWVSRREEGRKIIPLKIHSGLGVWGRSVGRMCKKGALCLCWTPLRVATAATAQTVVSWRASAWQENWNFPSATTGTIPVWRSRWAPAEISAMETPRRRSVTRELSVFHSTPSSPCNTNLSIVRVSSQIRQTVRASREDQQTEDGHKETHHRSHFQWGFKGKCNYLDCVLFVFCVV